MPCWTRAFDRKALPVLDRFRIGEFIPLRLPAFWLPLIWILLVIVCAVTAGWLPIAPPDLIDRKSVV